MTTKTKIIDGDAYEISQPYAAGHTLNENEARVLNQTRSENIGNNVRAKLKELKEAGSDAAALQAHVSEIDAGYEFNAANARAAAKKDPYEKEAEKLARELLRGHLAETGRKLTVAPEGTAEADWLETIASEVDRLAALPELVKTAKKNVDARSKRADEMKETLSGIAI